MEHGNRRAIVAALLANLGIAIAKFVGWAVTGAASLLAEAVHSCADSGNQALLLWGGAAAARRPSTTHPFGFGRERYFWAFVVSQVLFAMGGLFAIYEGVSKLRHPHPLNQPIVAVTILGIGIALEAFSFYTAVKVGRKEKGPASWWQFIRRTKNPELPVVLLEDLGALLGLLLALVGVGLAIVTGDPRFDALGSISIGVLLGVISILLAYEMKSLLIGESATARDLTTIRDAIEGDVDVRRIIHMKTQHLGPDEMLVAAKVAFDAQLEFAALASVIDRIEARARASFESTRLMIYIEPDVYKPPDEARAAPGASTAGSSDSDRPSSAPGIARPR